MRKVYEEAIDRLRLRENLFGVFCYTKEGWRIVVIDASDN